MTMAAPPKKNFLGGVLENSPRPHKKILKIKESEFIDFA